MGEAEADRTLGRGLSILGRAEVVGVSKYGTRLADAIDDSRGAAIVDIVNAGEECGVGGVKWASRPRSMARLRDPCHEAELL